MGNLITRSEGIYHLNYMARSINATAHEHGFWKDTVSHNYQTYATKIALAHGELSEALEALRHKNPKSEHIAEFSAVEEEFADAIIRIMDLAHEMGLCIGDALYAKMEYNDTREYCYGKDF
jgi:NTP pyrophosphatase (non-canonical NTP hydrolase)